MTKDQLAKRAATALLAYSDQRDGWGEYLCARLRPTAPAAAELLGVSGRTRLLLAVRAAPAGGVLLLDRSEGRHTSEHPSEVLARRLATVAPHLGIAFVASVPTPDAAASARRAGIDILDPRRPFGPYLHWAEEAIPVALPPMIEAPWTLEDWTVWIETTYGLQPRPDLEAVLAFLAGDGERALMAQDLHDLDIAPSPGAAKRLLRDTAKALAAEEFRNTRVVAEEAHRVLKELARARPLQWRPIEATSLERAAAALERAPSLAYAAALTARERSDLMALQRLISGERQRKPLGVGAPHAGRGRSERRWAAARRAVELGATATDVDRVAAEVLARAQDAAEAVLLALHDTRTDPAARFVSAARHADEILPVTKRPAGLTGTGSDLAWAGRPLEAYLDRSVEPELLRQLAASIVTIDAVLLEHGPRPA